METTIQKYINQLVGQKIIIIWKKIAIISKTETAKVTKMNEK